jgi:hypothetical protein
MHLLMVSPIPSHPERQGNSARIRALGQAMQAAGFVVHFLYYTMEGLTPEQRRDMTLCWDAVHVVPNDPRIASEPNRDGYRLDDWWDPRVAETARALHRRWRFAAVIVHYVWFSAVLEAFDSDLVRIIDTHDIFGGRDRILREAGLAPSWFFTSEADEARGLDRADIVLAIHGGEAAHFRALGHRDVRVVGHLLGQRTRLIRPRRDERLTVGYLASGNPLNLASFERLRAALAVNPAGDRLRCVLAGSICAHLRSESDPFVIAGTVDKIDRFYDSIDLVVNPMSGGTGLKIKSVEALFQGMPLLATASAMTGLPTGHPYHSLPDPEAMAEILRRNRFGPRELAALARASRASASLYAESVRAGLNGVVRAITG